MKITITVEDNHIDTELQEANFQDTLAAFASVTKHMMTTIVEEATKQEHPNLEDIKGELYDMVNITYSTLLTEFYPEMDLRPDLTAQAIMEAENAIIAKDPKVDC